MHLPLAVRERDARSSSLVADPLGTEMWVAANHVERGGRTRLDAGELGRAWMEGPTTRLHREFFARDQIDKNQYTIWVIAALAAMVGICVVAGMGFVASVIALASGIIPSTVTGMISPPLYVALLAILTGAFALVLFTVHRAREPESHNSGTGFAGFAWNLEDGSE